MIDWSSSVLETDASRLPQGRVLRLDPCGAIESEYPAACVVSTPSSDASLRLTREAPSAAMWAWAHRRGREVPPVCLGFSGNPVKWLQGHNLAGPSPRHHADLLRRCVQSFEACGLRFTLPDLFAVRRTRIDIALSFRLDNQQAVYDWLASAARFSRSRRGRPNEAATSVYWQKTSRHWSLKAYAKHDEYARLVVGRRAQTSSRLSAGDLQFLLDWSRGVLRLEVVLRSPLLCNPNPKAKRLGVLDDADFWVFYNRLQFSEGSRMIKQQVLDDVLPPHLELTFRRWKDGQDLRARLAHDTYYRHRREIKKLIGVDISIPAPTPDEVESKGDNIHSRSWLEPRQIDNEPTELTDRDLVLSFK